MSSQQQSQLSSTAEQFDPNLQLQNGQEYPDNQYSEQSQYSMSDDEQYTVAQKILSKQTGPNQQMTIAPQHSQNKIYSQNNLNKINQKICLTQMQACENQQMVKSKRNKDKAQRATVQQVLDPRTMSILAKFIRNQTFTEVNGCLSTGKQANVYHAECEKGDEPKIQYAIKIYKTSILIFKDRDRYVQGQFRFRKGYCSSNPRKMVKMWAEKQFRNLKRIQGILPCPVVYHVKSNVLVMDFLGQDGIPAPKLKDINKTQQQFSNLYLQLLRIIRILYQECKLVHADLSEYNLLYHRNEIYIIDVSQSVEHDHPHSLEFLRRDIININDFFNKKGVRVFTDKQVFDFIVTLDIPKNKQREALDQIIQNYDDQATRDQIFNRIKIHRNLANIPVQRVEEQIFGQKNTNSIYHHSVTGLKIDQKKYGEILQQNDQNCCSSSSQQSDCDQNKQEKEVEQLSIESGLIESKQGGKQKYQGLSKTQRKQKVKEQNREKRKDKMPKKTKKKLMNK